MLTNSQTAELIEPTPKARNINQFAKPEAITIAEAIKRLDDCVDLSWKRRRRLVSDAETACKWFGFSTAEVIAHPNNLRPRFRKLSPGGLGISNKRIQNVRASLRTLLRLAEVSCRLSFKVSLTPAWQRLVERIADPFLRNRLHCLAKFASANGILPIDVSDDLSNRLLTAVCDDSLYANPRTTHRNAVKAWNLLSDREAGWPPQKLFVPNYRVIKTPTVAPEPALQLEIDAFISKNSTDDPFDLSRRIVPLKSSTIKKYRYELRRYFGLLVSSGHSPADLLCLADLVRFERAQVALKLMVSQNSGGGRRGAANIARLLSSVALDASRNSSDSDEQARLSKDADALRKLSSRLNPHDLTLGQKNRERLRPLRDDLNLARLFLVPFAISKQFQTSSSPSRRDALTMQLALALMILTFCPIRVGSLSQLRFDKHLIWSRPNRSGDLRMEFGWRELKGSSPEVIPLPPECSKLLRLYQDRFHPKLCGSPSPFVFPGQQTNKPKMTGLLSTQLQALIFRRTGLRVNPHLYRHLVHLIVLTRFPGAYAMVSRVLTHRSLETAKSNYAYFDVELSMNTYHKLIRRAQFGEHRAVQEPRVDEALK